MKLKPQITACLTLLLALTLVPFTSRARYLNPTTGRFQTMDTYEGNNSEPISLHKYLYAHADPVNGVDPSGHEFNLIGLLFATAIQAIVRTAYDGVVIPTGQAVQEGLLAAMEAWEEDAYFDDEDDEWSEDSETIALTYNSLPVGGLGVRAMGIRGGGCVFMPSASIYYSQNSLNVYFNNPRYGSVYDLAVKLRAGKVQKMKAIRVVARAGRVISIDNRRLYAYQLAGKPIPTRAATPTELANAEKASGRYGGRFSAGPLGTKTPRIISTPLGRISRRR